jgi:alpha-tubulin suppressor-like RCC1 family protein
MARVDVGWKSVCATATSGDVYCWGDNARLQLARPGAPTDDTCCGPGLADLGGYETKGIFIGDDAVLAITKDNELINWGRVSGRVSSLGETVAPVLLPTLRDVVGAGVSVDYTSGPFGCAITSGSVYCWGSNKMGQLGTGLPESYRLPVLASLLEKDGAYPQQLAVSRNRMCARMTDGTIQCCGTNVFGQRGPGDGGTAALGCETPFDGSIGGPAVQVATSSNTTCALVRSGEVYCWGGNSNGELGRGSMDYDPHPTPAKVMFQ